VRCTICEGPRELHECGRGWILKESLAYHLKSDAHIRSENERDYRDSLRKARYQVQESVEEEMDFVTLKAQTHHLPGKSREAPQADVTDIYADFTGDFNIAGKDHTASAVDERRRLEREANNFDLWHGADFVPEVDPSDSALLLDELERDDILTVLLQNACMYCKSTTFSFC